MIITFAKDIYPEANDRARAKKRMNIKVCIDEKQRGKQTNNSYRKIRIPRNEQQ